MRKKVVGIGGGGHAKVCIDLIEQCADLELVGLVDSDPSKTGGRIFDTPILGTDAILRDLLQQGVKNFFLAFGGVGNLRPRRALFEKALAAGLKPITIIHPSAVVSRRAEIAEGVTIMAAAVVNAGARIETDVLVNTGAIVEHDCDIAAHCHIAPGACLAGNSRVGTCSHIGAGATVRQGITIGEYAVVGAGAVVVKDVPSSQVFTGVPAKLLRHVLEPPE